MKSITKFFDDIKSDYTKGDIGLIIIVCILLIFLFKDNISGFVSLTELDDQVESNKMESMVKNNQINEKIGIELKKRNIQSTPSTKKQLEIINSKPQPIDNINMNNLNPGLNIQDSVIFRPFDEIWNPGFMPLDMVFKDTQKPIENPLITLKPQVYNKDKFNNSGDIVEHKIILMYAPWCGHSKRMLPDWEKIKNEYNGKVINGKKYIFETYNSEVNNDKEKIKEYKVKGFPTLFIEKNGVKENFPYREYEKIKNYIENN